MPLKTILITGCSSGGIGSALALTLATRGHHVFATARNPSKISDALTSLSNVTILPLDVTSTESVAAAAKSVADSGRGLDVLVNNAGMGEVRPILDWDVGEAQGLFDTNFWGVVRTVQAFAGLLVERRGRVVNVSSVGGVVNVPWHAMYSSSKAALNALSETLRLELKPFGVSVVVILAGTVSSQWDANNGEMRLPVDSLYAGIKNQIQKWASGERKPDGTSPEDFAEMILDDVVGTRTSGKVWRGEMSGVMRFVVNWMPTFVLDAMMSYNQGLKELAALVAEKRKSS